jgi:hypothetical protein
MKRGLTYLTVAIILVACADSAGIAEENALSLNSEGQVNSLANTTEQSVTSTDPVDRSKECLVLGDSIAVQNFIDLMEVFIQNDDITSIASMMNISDEYPHDSTADLSSYVKNFFIEDLIDAAARSEVESSSRFYTENDGPCSRYVIIRNFTESEFSVLFYLIKENGSVTINRIELAG